MFYNYKHALAGLADKQNFHSRVSKKRKKSTKVPTHDLLGKGKIGGRGNEDERVWNKNYAAAKSILPERGEGGQMNPFVGGKFK